MSMPWKRNTTRLLVCVLLTFGTLRAQRTQDAAGLPDSPGATKRHLGYPQDWSSRHVVMSGTNVDETIAAGTRDPRHVYNFVSRQLALQGRTGPVRANRPVKVDWSVSLENGFVPQDQYPAKYRFDVTGQDCNSDYVLYALRIVSGTQANIVGINNLYTGSTTAGCNAGKPWVAFAYNTLTNGGQILTSPAISVDGTKAAFVESTATGSYLHVLVLPNPIPAPPSQVGTVLSPQTPTSCANPVTPGCMSTLQFSTTSNSGSSPWIDYSSDTIYVGDDAGKLYKIQPAFRGGAPAVVNDTNWPVTVVTSGTFTKVTDPIVDNVTGRIFMGDANGYLYAVDMANPAHAFSARTPIGWIDQGAGTGVVEGPIVVADASNPGTNQVFAFTGCSDVLGVGGAVSQLPANFTNSASCRNGVSCTTVDLGSASGSGDCTTRNVHNGVFDNTFWLNGTSSGHMMACGFRNNGGKPAIPQMYFFPFSSGRITSTGSSSWAINNTKGDECSPLTEFYDGTTDRAFFGVGSSDGFIEASVLTTSASTPNCTNPPTSSCVTSPKALGGTSGIVVDNRVGGNGTNIYFSTLAPGSVNGQKCNVAGGAANPYCAVKLTQTGLQ